MESETPHYTLSHDYERMRELMEEGSLLGFIDYEIGRNLRDPVRIQKRTIIDALNNKAIAYDIGVRGCGYVSAWDDIGGGWDDFVNQCRKYHLSYIVPNAEVTDAD